MTVDRDEVQVRPLTWGEWVAYQVGHAAGSAAGWIHEILHKLRRNT